MSIVLNRANSIAKTCIIESRGSIYYEDLMAAYRWRTNTPTNN